jgi:hypothetical protein
MTTLPIMVMRAVISLAYLRRRERFETSLNATSE